MNRPILLFVVLILWCVNANAATANDFRESITSLATLTGQGQLELNQARASYRLALPLASRLTTKNHVLHLEFTNSISLLKKRSQLVVLVNDIVIDQIALDPFNPKVITDIAIPSEFLKDGYNNVEFRVAQHFTEECEDPASPELWTQINAGNSYFKFDYAFQAIDFTLADLGRLFDKRLPNYHATLIMTPKQLDDAHLTWGSLVAQGIALHLEYILPTFDYKTAQLPSTPPANDNRDPLSMLDQNGIAGDAVLVGTAQELTPFLSSEQAAKITGPYLGLVPARDPSYRILLVSGKTQDDVLAAATTFAFARQAFPDERSLVVKALEFPVIDAKKLPKLLQAGNTYRLEDLGYKTQTLAGLPIGFQVSIPPDLLRASNNKVTFRLNLAYGAALREDSVLNIYLNNLFESAIRLNDANGARYNDYTISIPITSFMPGVNNFNFEPVMPPLVTGLNGKCSLVQYQNARLTLYGDSTLELPNADNYVALPDLTLFSRTGFPYTDNAYGGGVGIVVRETNIDAVLSAWQLMARLSQLATVPLFQTQLSFDTINDRDLIIIGSRHALKTEDIAHSPIELKGALSFSHQVTKVSTNEALPWFERLLALASTNATFSDQYSKLTFEKSSLGSQGLLISYPSAQHSGKLITLITGETSSLLYERVKELVTLPVWNNLNGNIAIWRDTDTLFSQEIGERFYRGESTVHNKLSYYFSLYGYQWLIAIIVVVALSSLLGHRWLRRYKARKHGNVNEYKS